MGITLCSVTMSDSSHVSESEIVPIPSFEAPMGTAKEAAVSGINKNTIVFVLLYRP